MKFFDITVTELHQKLVDKELTVTELVSETSTNCAVLGVALLNINLGHNFLQSALYGFAAAVGFSLVMVLFASIRERLVVADVPAPFRGNAIALVTAGLMSLAFMGFSGLVKL